MDKRNVAEVVPLKIKLNKTFHYLIPAELKDKIDIGKRVKVPFGNKKITGLIINFLNSSDIRNLKQIEDVLDPIPILSQEILNLVEWMAEYYICPKGTIISHIVPSKVSRKKINSFFNQKKYQESYNNLDKIINKNKNNSKNIIDQEIFFTDKSTASSHSKNKPVLFQYHSYEVRDRYYNLCIRKVLQEGKQVLILIPDRWSCVQLKKKLAEKYGKKIGIFDKKFDQSQKYLRYLEVQLGDIDIVIGTRSNIFLPFKNLGLIIVEQENSILYKEERIPRYNAKEVAIKRSIQNGYKVILGSYAPDIESYSYATSANPEYILRHERNSTKYGPNFPKIQLINMEEEKSFQRIISFKLQQEIARCLKEKNKIALFLNRRGFAGYLACSQCGHVIKCPECNHLLSYHVDGGSSIVACHVCKKTFKMIKNCPECGNGKIKPLGPGTQNVEDLIKRMFPKSTIKRLDIDIAPGIGAQKKIINEFNKGEIDILIGTQIIFRQMNYSNVGLIGFILVDHLLNLPDYRSAELSFQFISKLALDFAERKEEKTIMIQTCQPEHHSLQSLVKLDYEAFCQKEIEIREELDYPPITKIIKIDFIGKIRKNVKKNTNNFLDYINDSGLNSKYNLGSQSSKDNLVLVRDKDNYRMTCMLRINEQKQDIVSFKSSLFEYVSKYQSHDVKLIVDINPIKMY